MKAKPSLSQIIKAFIACDVRISIDDLNLCIHVRGQESERIRSYDVTEQKPLPQQVLAFIHWCEGK